MQDRCAEIDAARHARTVFDDSRWGTEIDGRIRLTFSLGWFTGSEFNLIRFAYLAKFACHRNSIRSKENGKILTQTFWIDAKLLQKVISSQGDNRANRQYKHEVWDREIFRIKQTVYLATLERCLGRF